MAEGGQEVAEKRKGRGKAKLGFLGRNQVGKLLVVFKDGVPIGDNSVAFSALVGRLGKDPNLLPLSAKRWPKVHHSHKDRVMLEIKQHFEFPEECNKYVLKMLNLAWKDEKGDLKLRYFKPFTSTVERVANCPPNFPEDQWSVLVQYWEDPHVDGITKKNIVNRSKNEIMHIGGSKTFMKHAIEIEKDPNRDAPSGTSATRVELYKKVHTRKNKAPVSDLAKSKMDEMKEMTDKAIEEGLDIYESEPNDIFSKVMGVDGKGRRRCFGRATFPGESSNSKTDSVQVMSLKRKVVEVEEELESTKQQYTDLKKTTNQMQDSINTTNAELNKMKGLLQLFFATGVRFKCILQNQVQENSTPTPSSATHPNNQ